VRAASELTRRGWMYHKDLKAWIMRVPNTEPEQKSSDRVEIGSFLVFDVLNWEVVRKDGMSVELSALEAQPPPLPQPT
jgi:CCR4-NOT transcription complex subunit 2